MPEMPEVENIRKLLLPRLTGQKIERVEVLNSQVIAHPSVEEFVLRLTGQIITDLTRRGKFLTILLADGDRLTFHLRMTGQPIVVSSEMPLDKHTHLRVFLPGGMEFRYTDQRRFGRFWLLSADETDTVTGQDKLGPEPYDPAVTGLYLKKMCGKRKIAAKQMLLDQSVVAGIGNIYADEILFTACVHPKAVCQNLSDQAWESLARAIPKIMDWGIKAGAMIYEDYLAGKGLDYREINGLRAYGRAGDPCRICQTPMKRIVISGRSSCYCPVCQRETAEC